MITLIDLEKKINSELTTKIKETKIKHDQIFIDIDIQDLISEYETIIHKFDLVVN